jgi:methionine aminopeptidase
VIIKKSAQEIEKMAQSGLILAATLDQLQSKIRPDCAIFSISCADFLMITAGA